MRYDISHGGGGWYAVFSAPGEITRSSWHEDIKDACEWLQEEAGVSVGPWSSVCPPVGDSISLARPIAGRSGFVRLFQEPCGGEWLVLAPVDGGARAARATVATVREAMRIGNTMADLISEGCGEGENNAD